VAIIGALSILAAWLSWVLVERRLLRLKDRAVSRPLRDRLVRGRPKPQAIVTLPARSRHTRSTPARAGLI